MEFLDDDLLASRIREVNKHLSSFSVLTDNGIEIPDEQTSYQILCPFHGDKNKPSARYYAASGRSESHFYCFKCKLRLESVGLFAKFKSIRFYDALSLLEKKYGIIVDRVKYSAHIVSPSDRGSDYKSHSWNDLERLWNLVESKLLRNKHKCTFNEFINLCRLLDNVLYDYNKTGESSLEMIGALHKANEKIDNLVDLSLT